MDYLYFTIRNDDFFLYYKSIRFFYVYTLHNSGQIIVILYVYKIKEFIVYISIKSLNNITYHAFYTVVRYQNTKNTFYKILYPEALYENDNNSKGHKFHLNYLLSI